MSIIQEITYEQEQRFLLQGSLLDFTQTFYKLRTGRLFNISEPIGRESHHITICKELHKAFNGETERLIIQVPPRYGKTELLIHFVAWALSIYPDSNFIYTSYSHSLAKKQTQTIKEIINLPHYRKIFDISLKDDTQAKDNFELAKGGSVYSVGAQGTITGRGAGIQSCNRFGGAFIMDDMHKPNEADSDTIREGVIDWFFNTAQSRVNNPGRTPFIFIGQEVHEDSLSARLAKDSSWKVIKIKALDENENALNPTMHDRYQLLKMKEENPYVFAAQYQQDPQPAGGGIFKPEWFHIVEEDQQILETFITADTAETDKDYNDATVFSFWGLHKIYQFGVDSGMYGLQWLACQELRVDPKDLQSEFMQFYADCMRYAVKPNIIAIEKKSTGATLLSVLGSLQGLSLIDITRTKASGSKTARFLEAQPYVAKKCISLHKYAKHTNMCLEHCRKITANNSHRFDDIADTMYDAIKLALIDKVILNRVERSNKRSAVITGLVNQMNNQQKLRSQVPW